MNARVMDTSSVIGRWISNMGNGISNTLFRIGRARSAAELARQGYHEEAKKIMLDDQEDS